MSWHPFRNLGLKFVALLLGTLLWFTVSGQQAERTLPDVPVVYRNTPAGLELTDQTSVVAIRVRGLDSQLRTMQPRDFEARVDLAGARPGAQRFAIRTDQVSAPLGLEVTSVEPGSAMAVLEPAGTVNLPVKPFIDGTPAPGFVVSGVTVEPLVVTVVGPAKRLASTTSATTDRVGIEGASTTVIQTVGVGVTEAALRLREARSVRVTVSIEKAGERLFAASHVTVRNLEPGLRGTVDPAVVSVLLRGADSLLSRLDGKAVVPYVDVTGLGKGTHTVPVLFDPKGTLTLQSIRPTQVTVTIN
jgi:YbbR domain-containing protein